MNIVAVASLEWAGYWAAEGANRSIHNSISMLVEGTGRDGMLTRALASYEGWIRYAIYEEDLICPTADLWWRIIALNTFLIQTPFRTRSSKHRWLEEYGGEWRPQAYSQTAGCLGEIKLNASWPEIQRKYHFSSRFFSFCGAVMVASSSRT